MRVFSCEMVCESAFCFEIRQGNSDVKIEKIASTLFQQPSFYQLCVLKYFLSPLMLNAFT